MESGDASEAAVGVLQVTGSRTNCYVVTDGDDVCLVDTGYPRDFAAVVVALERLGRSAADVTAVALTHAHADHIGSAERFRTEHGAQVHAHVEEAAHARGEREQRLSDRYLFSRLWWPRMACFVLNAVRAGAWKVDHVREVRTFQGSTAPLDVPGSPVAVFTPGHTSGHCCFHLPHRGALLTGDALVTLDPLTMERGPRLLSRAFHQDHEQAVRSLERLRPLDAEIILPGHGEPFEGSPADAVEQALATST
ncbi:MAG TPA: MBL fold metallo-hydrolase [Nitriliruptorales bacterium]|nr:MBL fold metallo-hydrolase [Nitriliruptorales bacterium]